VDQAATSGKAAAAAGGERAVDRWREDETTGRAHGMLGASTEGKKGMQGKETVGVLPCTVDDL